MPMAVNLSQVEELSARPERASIGDLVPLEARPGIITEINYVTVAAIALRCSPRACGRWRAFLGDCTGQTLKDLVKAAWEALAQLQEAT